MLGLNGVAIDEFPAEVAVNGVKIQAMAAGKELVDEVEILAKFIESAGLAGVVAGGLDTAAGQGGVGFFKATYVVTLPTVQRDWRGSQTGKRGLSINA
jgi:hypothetical protein